MKSRFNDGVKKALEKTDIEARYQKMEIELRKYEERYRVLTQTTMDGFVVMDMEGRFLEVNDAYCRMSGYSRDALLTMHVQDVEANELPDQTTRHMEAVVHKGWDRFQSSHRKANGTAFAVQVCVRLLATEGFLLCTITDITESLRTNDELKESEEIFQCFMEHSPVYTFFKDENMRSLRLSKNYEKMLGKPLAELIGKTMNELFPSELAESMIACDMEIMKEGKVVTLEEELNGRFYSTIKFPIYIQGKPRYLAGYTFDITERRQAELEIIMAKAAAEAANATKSQFLANMAHEIRTPLNGIMGTLQLLEMTSLTEEQATYIQISKASSTMLLGVINDILDYSKVEAGKIELEKTALELRNVMNDITRFFKTAAEDNGLIMTCLIDNDIPDNLIGDPFRLRQILTNLVGNAIKFTKKGRIDLIARKIDALDTRTVKLEFVVKDTGIGIPEERKDVLFKSFSQVDSSHARQYGGTGLGLAICKGLVERMGGEIWVESSDGEGSSFYFTCVLEKGATAPLSQASLQTTLVKTSEEKPIRVLLVEDDKVAIMLTGTFLREKGYEVKAVENGKEAVEVLRHTSFDVIIMDVQMPFMDGFTATGIIRQMEPSRATPIIAMTAYPRKEDREKCIDAGMDDYLSKPVNFNELFSMIQKWTKANGLKPTIPAEFKNKTE